MSTLKSESSSLLNRTSIINPDRRKVSLKHFTQNDEENHKTYEKTYTTHLTWYCKIQDRK